MRLFGIAATLCLCTNSPPAQAERFHVDQNFQFAQDRASAVRDGVFTDRLIVKFHSTEFMSAVSGAGESSSAWTALCERWQVRAITSVFPPQAENDPFRSRLGLDRFAIVWVPEGTTVHAMAAEFSQLSSIVELAELDLNAQAHANPVNDPLFNDQWHLLNSGQLVNGHPGNPGADIGAAGAWQSAPPLSQVIVAILDTGVSQSHPDLQNILVGCYNTATSDPALCDDNQQVSHGTYCAGICAAEWNNNIGISGLAPSIRIQAVRVLQNIQLGSQTSCARGIDWARANGARVISMSLGWGSASTGGALDTAVAAAVAQGMVVVSSVGNSPGSPVGYPAKFAGVIGVGGSDALDQGWAGATTGAEVDIVAPADSILTTCDDNSGLNSYSVQSGTSMACPMVAGVAALVLSANPALSASEVQTILQNSSRDLGAPGWDPVFGFGRLDAERAVVMARSMLPCQADFDRDRSVTVADVFAFLNAWFGDVMAADSDLDGTLTPTDIFTYLSRWLVGC